MLDSRVRPLIDPVSNFLGRRLASIGATANMVTFIGFGFGVSAFVALALQYYGWGLILFLLNRVFDGLDGAVARHQGQTDLGGYLDIVLDFILYALIPLGFAIAMPDHAIAAALLIVSFVGTGTSFLAFAIFAEKRGISTEIRGKKSLYYIGGLAEGTETIIILSIMFIMPQYFHILAYFFATICWLTTGTRIYWACEVFNTNKSES